MKTFVIIEVQPGETPWIFFANAWAGDPPRLHTEEEAAREVDSFIRARPESRYLVVDIASAL